jgi:hypothetical protein
LLGSTICLAIGASIFATCPSRIREFSRDQWTDEFNRSLAHYWAMSWKRRWARFACIFFYVTGALGAGIVLISKLWNVGRFIVQNW